MSFPAKYDKRTVTKEIITQYIPHYWRERGFAVAKPQTFMRVFQKMMVDGWFGNVQVLDHSRSGATFRTYTFNKKGLVNKDESS